MKKYIVPTTDIDSVPIYEYEILGGTDGPASQDDMASFPGLPVTGKNQSNPTFNSNNFTSTGQWDE